MVPSCLTTNQHTDNRLDEQYSAIIVKLSESGQARTTFTGMSRIVTGTYLLDKVCMTMRWPMMSTVQTDTVNPTATACPHRSTCAQITMH